MKGNYNALWKTSTCRKRSSLATACTVDSSFGFQTLRHSFPPFLYTQSMKLTKTKLTVFSLNSHNCNVELIISSKKILSFREQALTWIQVPDRITALGYIQPLLRSLWAGAVT